MLKQNKKYGVCPLSCSWAYLHAVSRKERDTTVERVIVFNFMSRYCSLFASMMWFLVLLQLLQQVVIAQQVDPVIPLPLMFPLPVNTSGNHTGPHTRWLVNYPKVFHDKQVNGLLEDIKNDTQAMVTFQSSIQYHLDRTDGFTDGEIVDALEHFFWGLKGGVAMELGALDGSPNTRSMTYEYEKSMGWRRVLIDANPLYRAPLLKNSPLAFSANAAICANQTTVHFVAVEYVGGILEFMGMAFMKEYHGKYYNAMVPPGNVSSLNFDLFPEVKQVECIPLSHVLHKAHINHINYFILDVEGGELEVLKSVNWNHIKFDVLCIETEEVNRPPGYAAKMTSFLAAKGYINATAQQGRNIWYTHKDFIPSTKPGLDPQCYNGARKAKRQDDWYLNRRTPAFKPCPLAVSSTTSTASHHNTSSLVNFFFNSGGR